MGQGMWIAVVISIFSYLSVEMIAVAAGEAEDPERREESVSRHHCAAGCLYR